MHLTFGFANVAALNETLGDRLFCHIQASSKRQNEISIYNMDGLTECALTCVSSGYRDDIILQLDIGDAHQLAQKLFPTTFQKAVCSNGATDIFLTRAQISEAESIFSPQILYALESSRLRRWEKLGIDETRTECISLNLNCKDTHNGVLYLYLASDWAKQVPKVYIVENFECISQ